MEPHAAGTPRPTMTPPANHQRVILPDDLLQLRSGDGLVARQVYRVALGTQDVRTHRVDGVAAQNACVQRRGGVDGTPKGLSAGGAMVQAATAAGAAGDVREKTKAQKNTTMPEKHATVGQPRQHGGSAGAPTTHRAARATQQEMRPMDAAGPVAAATTYRGRVATVSMAMER